MALDVYTASRVIGRISLADGRLAGSTAGVQDIADTELAKTGDPAAAYTALDGYTNGYLTIVEAPPAQRFNPAEKRGPGGRWVKDAAALEALATTIRQAQVANVIVTGEHAGRTADLLDEAAAALKRGDRATAEKILARLRGAAAAHKHLRKHGAQIRHHHERVIGPVENYLATRFNPAELRGLHTGKWVPSSGTPASHEPKYVTSGGRVAGAMTNEALDAARRAGGSSRLLAKLQAARDGDGDPAKLTDALRMAQDEGVGHDVLHAITLALAQGHHERGQVSHPAADAATESGIAALGPSVLGGKGRSPADRLLDFEASMNATALAARVSWREGLHPRDRRGEFASKGSLLDTADHAGKLLGPNDEVPARLRTAAEAAGNKDYATVARQVSKARESLARNPQGGHSGIIEADVAEHPMAKQRRALEGRLRAHLRQARERTRPGAGAGPVASVTRGLGWDLLELELISREKFTPSLHPRDRRGEFARKPYGHVPAGMNTPNMRLAEKAGLVKAGSKQESGKVQPQRPRTTPRRPAGGGKPRQAGKQVRVTQQRRRVTQTTGPGGTLVTDERSTQSGTVSIEQFTSAVDSLQKSITAQRAELDADHKAEIDHLKDQIAAARAAAVEEVKSEQKATDKKKAIRKWITHLLALVGVAVLTYLEAKGGGGASSEAIMASLAATGPLIVSEAVDLVKKQ